MMEDPTMKNVSYPKWALALWMWIFILGCALALGVTAYMLFTGQ